MHSAFLFVLLFIPMLFGCTSCSVMPVYVAEGIETPGVTVGGVPTATPIVSATSTPKTTPQPTPTASPLPTLAPTPTLEPTPAPTPAPTPTPYDIPTFTANPNNNVVYLTFDDGPVGGTNRVLDILNSYGIKGTFFTVGQAIRHNPNIARRIVAEGHNLACHTNTHDFNKIYSSPEAFAADVTAWRQTVINVIGYDAGAYMIRFPGGSVNGTLSGRPDHGEYLSLMRTSGYRIYDWLLGNNDKWPGGNTDNLPFEDYLVQSYYKTLTAFGRTNYPLIFLMHDSVDESVDMLAWMIEDLLARGYVFGDLNALTQEYTFYG